jgi:hypothetical protein
MPGWPATDWRLFLERCEGRPRTSVNGRHGHRSRGQKGQKLARMFEACDGTHVDNTLCLGLRCHPPSRPRCSAGIAALSAENYPALVAIHTK